MDIVERLRHRHNSGCDADILLHAAAEIERLQELLRGVGANRYWEGRWRDERERCAKIARLEGARAAMTDDPCAVSLERMAQRIEVVIRKGE